MGFVKIFLIVSLPLVLLLLRLPLEYELKNTCKDFDSYLNLYFSSNCYHCPDNNKNTLEIINRYTGLGEEHQVQTEDGYILTLFRIPTKNPRGVILFQHGVSHDSRFFVAQQNESISLYFWRAGYDVWLTNTRGTSYSQNHINLTTNDEKFWDFTFHEVGIYDVSATAKYVKSVTKTKLIFVGLSMGASAGSVYASLRPEEAAENLNLMVNLAPFYFTTGTTSPLKYIFLGWSQFLLNYNLNNYLNCHSLLEHHSWYVRLFRGINRLNPFKKYVMYLVQIHFGGHRDEFDPALFNLMSDQLGSATSLRMFAHLYQMTESGGKFQMYDYGPQKNKQVYNTENPPLYPLENIQVPIYMSYGADDNLVPPEDVETLFGMLPNRSKIYGKDKVERFGHHDFVFGIHRNERVYRKILELLERIKE